MFRSFSSVRVPGFSRRTIDAFVVDVDGVLTDGSFLYGADGKRYKRFGPDDADALQLLSSTVRIEVVTADHRGYNISNARVSDMGLDLFLVPSSERLNWVTDRFGLDSLAYMGDSFQDAPLLSAAALGLCPKNAHPRAKRSADVVTKSRGGNRAVAEACAVIARINKLPIARLL